MYNCNGNCKLCSHLIISDDISIVPVGTVDNLVIDIPQGSYANCDIYCIVMAQLIPDDATVTMPVSVSIGGDTTTLYPLICSRTGLQATACQVNTRTRIKTQVRTSATSGSFVALNGLGSCFVNRLASLPATTVTIRDTKATTDTNTTDTAKVQALAVKTTAKTNKGVTANE